MDKFVPDFIMTVSYTGDVANASGFGCFNKILLKWKGSVYKLIYKVCVTITQEILTEYSGTYRLSHSVLAAKYHLQKYPNTTKPD